MAVQDADRLRELVNDFYHGLITPESYRQQRAELLDNIGSPVEDHLEITTKAQQRRQSDADPGSTPSPRAADSSSVTQRPRGLVIAGVAILGVGIAAVLLTRTPDSNQDANIPPQQDEIPTERGTNSGDALLQEFLSRNDWSDNSLANFAIAWRTLDDQQRELAQAGLRFRRLAGVVNQRLREESALGTAETDLRVVALTEFATELNIAYRESQAASSDTQSVPDVVPGLDEEPEIEISAGSTDDTDTELIVNVSPDVGETPNQPAFADSSAITASDESIAAVKSAREAEPTLAEEVLSTPPKDAEPVPEQEFETAPAEESVSRIDKASIVAINDPCPAEIANSRRPYCDDVLADGSKGPALVVLPAGDFDMGSDRNDTESPMHQVRINKPIAMSRYEITVAEYGQFCASMSLPCPDRVWESDDYPVVLISWNDAILYTQWLSEETGFKYRLSSEAEWEFSARAGTQSPYFFGDEITPSSARSLVNGQADSPLPRSDRTVNRNQFRLHHMSGNVREWVQDAWYSDYDDAPANGIARVDDSEDRRVVRGGSYSDPGTKLRSAAREPLDRSHRDTVTGFRIIREIVQ